MERLLAIFHEHHGTIRPKNGFIPGSGKSANFTIGANYTFGFGRFLFLHSGIIRLNLAAGIKIQMKYK